MGMSGHRLYVLDRIKDLMLVRNEPSANGQDQTEGAKPPSHRAVWRQVGQEKILVKHKTEDKQRDKDPAANKEYGTGASQIELVPGVTNLLRREKNTKEHKTERPENKKNRDNMRSLFLPPPTHQTINMVALSRKLV